MGRDELEWLVWNAWQMVATALKLTNKVKGEGPPLPSIVVRSIPEAEPRRLYVLSADIEANGHTGDCPGCAAPASHGRAIQSHTNEPRERIRTIN